MTDRQIHEREDPLFMLLLESFLMPKACWKVLHNHSLTIMAYSLKESNRDAMNQFKHRINLKT